jgi:hypothetical protein
MVRELSTFDGGELAIGEKSEVEAVVRDIRPRTRRRYSSDENTRIVLQGLRGR